MFLRLFLRETGQPILFNVDQIVRVEPGHWEPPSFTDPDEDEDEEAEIEEHEPPEVWCRIYHMPTTIDDAGDEVLTITEVRESFDRMSMLLSGKWLKEPL